MLTLQEIDTLEAKASEHLRKAMRESEMPDTPSIREAVATLYAVRTLRRKVLRGQA
jgi:hypothetical protein